MRRNQRITTDILARGGTIADVPDAPRISEYIARKHYAKWSPARQQRISSIMSLVQSGEPGEAAMPPMREQDTPVIQ